MNMIDVNITKIFCSNKQKQKTKKQIIQKITISKESAKFTVMSHDRKLDLGYQGK